MSLIEPPADLFDKVMHAITREYRRFLAIRISAAVFVGAGALYAILSAGRELLEELAESGFLQYGSLIATDFRTVAASWQDYSITMLESLPVVTLFVFCALALILVVAINYSIYYLSALRKKTYAV